MMRVPVLSKYLETISLARLSWCLAMTHNTGMNVRPCVALSLDATSNPYYTQHRKPIDAVLKQGDSIHAAFSKADVFEADFLHSVAVGEQSGRLSETMEKLSQQYESRAKAQAAALAVSAGFLVWGMIGLIMILLIFRLAMFYIGTISDAANGIF